MHTWYPGTVSGYDPVRLLTYYVLFDLVCVPLSALASLLPSSSLLLFRAALAALQPAVCALPGRGLIVDNIIAPETMRGEPLIAK